MSVSMEMKKLKRTGYVSAFLAGGLLAGAFPVVNMLVRAENFTALPGNPIQILISANWQMMAMLNILLSVCGACMMYHAEYADNAIQKMQTLPVRQGSLFLGKFCISFLALSAMIIIETAALAGCAAYWFSDRAVSVSEILKIAGFQIVITLPTVMLMLLIASVCRNMWVSLGTGVILVFTMSIVPSENVVISLFPFCTPYQTLLSVSENERTVLFFIVCIAEVALTGIAESLFRKIFRKIREE